MGAGKNITAAVIGTNGRGLAHIDCLTSLPGVEVIYICDVDDRAIAKGIKEAGKKQAKEPKGLKDFRKALIDPTLNVVTIATPDHWHTPMAIMAMAAGKHVYLEKPCSQNPYEGELLLQAVDKYQRIVQMGAQRRSSAAMRQIIPEIPQWPHWENLFWQVVGMSTIVHPLATANRPLFPTGWITNCGRVQRRAAITLII